MRFMLAASLVIISTAAAFSILAPDARMAITGKQAHAKPAPAPMASPAKKAASPADILQLTGTRRFIGDAKSARGMDLDGFGVSFEGGRVRTFLVEPDGSVSSFLDSGAYRAMSAKELTNTWFNATFNFATNEILNVPAAAKFAEARKVQVGNALFLPDPKLPDDAGAELFINTKSGTIYYFTSGGFGQFNPMKMPVKPAKK